MSFDSAERLNLTIAGGAVATSAVLAPPHFTASLALGAVMEVVNYRALRRSTEAFFRGQIVSGGVWSAGFGMRFGLLAGCMTVALWYGAHPVGLVLGLSTIVPAAIIAALRNPPAPVAGPMPPPDDPSWNDWNPWLAQVREPGEDEDE